MGEKVKRGKGEEDRDASFSVSPLCLFPLFLSFPDKMTTEFEKVILRKS
jgi:hypothetical protein